MHMPIINMTCCMEQLCNDISGNNRIIIWTSCATFVLFVTLLITYTHCLFNIQGALVVLLLLESILQLYKIVYECYAWRGKYGLCLAVRITNCWTIYQILNTTLITGGLFTYLIMLAEIEAMHIPRRVWLVIIILLACGLSLKSIQPFVRKEKYEGERRRPMKLISSFVPRFVILYTFLVYYFIAYVEATEQSFIPTLCVAYLGGDRLITMFNTIREYERQEYYSLFRDTVRWIRRNRGL